MNAANLVIAVLLQRLGGHVEITHEEFNDASGKVDTWEDPQRMTTHYRVRGARTNRIVETTPVRKDFLAALAKHLEIPTAALTAMTAEEFEHAMRPALPPPVTDNVIETTWKAI